MYKNSPKRNEYMYNIFNRNHKAFDAISSSMLSTSFGNEKVTYMQIMEGKSERSVLPISSTADGKKMTNIFNLELSNIFPFMFH